MNTLNRAKDELVSKAMALRAQYPLAILDQGGAETIRNWISSAEKLGEKKASVAYESAPSSSEIVLGIVGDLLRGARSDILVLAVGKPLSVSAVISTKPGIVALAEELMPAEHVVSIWNLEDRGGMTCDLSEEGSDWTLGIRAWGSFGPAVHGLAEGR